MPRDTSGRERLDQMLAEAESSPRAARLGTVILLLLSGLLLCIDYAPRVWPTRTTREPLPRFAWRDTARYPTPPMNRRPAWGDLGGLAPTLLYRSGIGRTPSLLGMSESDRWGMRNSVERGDATRGRGAIDILVAGDSFMTAGPEDEVSFAGQMASASSRRVYNLALPGSGPAGTMANLLHDPELGQRGERWVVWGMATRSLEARYIEQGLGPPRRVGGTRQRVAERVGLVRRYPTLWARYLKLTSGLRRVLIPASVVMPPMSLDNGEHGRVRLGYFDEHGRDAMLFLNQSVTAATRLAAEDEIEAMAASIVEIDQQLQARGIRLVVLFVPTKYEFYAPDLRRHDGWIVPGVSPLDESRPRTAARLANLLEAHGVRAIDAWPTLRAEQKRLGDQGLLYWADDTHWNRYGIAVGVQRVIDVISAHESGGG